MAKKASEHFKLYKNPNGPAITTVARPVIEENGLYFKDIDGTGTVSKVNDWRMGPTWPGTLGNAAAVKGSGFEVVDKWAEATRESWEACNLPKGDEELAVNADGVCISPNDVPGYDKDQYMPEELKDENGKAYAYRDAAGNYYELNFGLSY